jgi:hypothetical protein
MTTVASTTTPRPAKPWVKSLAVVVGTSILLAVLVIAFALPASRSGPHDVPIGVVGWAGYFRAGVSSATFSYLSHYTWQTVWRWLRRKHRKSTWKQLRHRYCGGGWWPATEEWVLIDLEKIGTTRYRYRGAVIPSPWPDIDEDTTTAA